ncbi:TPA: hypothetical protein ACXIMI_001447 [Stenotrophomonas maltophilia]
MSKEEMMQVHIKGKSRYLPWPELYHSARSLFAVAREYKPGSAHVVTAAVVLSAFAVEGFCQTLGPQVLRETWDAPKQPSTGQGSEVGSKKAKKFGDERLPVCDKLKKIGKACGVSVDYGNAPWKSVKELFAARDALAHAKPQLHQISEIISVPAGGDPRFHLHDALRRKHQPLHDLDKLEDAMKAIDSGLREIWEGAGMDPGAMSMLGTSMWSWSPVGQ